MGIQFGVLKVPAILPLMKYISLPICLYDNI